MRGETSTLHDSISRRVQANLAGGSSYMIPDRHVAEQRTERRPVVALAGQPASARLARATALTHLRYLRRNHRGLQRRRQPLRLVQPQPELDQADVRPALDARDLCLRHHPGPHFRHQLHVPYQLRHPHTLIL